MTDPQSKPPDCPTCRSLRKQSIEDGLLGYMKCWKCMKPSVPKTAVDRITQSLEDEGSHTPMFPFRAVAVVMAKLLARLREQLKLEQEVCECRSMLQLDPCDRCRRLKELCDD